MDGFNIRYEIIGRRDGRWEMQAYNSDNKAIFATVTVATSDDAWKFWMMLNGYHYADHINFIGRETESGTVEHIDDNTEAVA